MKAVGWVAAVLVAVFALGGCTIATRRAEPGPVTVSHAFGSTTVTGTPAKVVTLGDRWTDAVLAVGVTPVARVGGEPTPWAPDGLAAVPALDASADLIERIGAVHPDLILLDLLPADRATYDRMTALAPTIPRDPNHSWREQLRVAASVLRRTDAADRWLAEYDATLTEAARAHPDLVGRTYAVTWLASETQLFALTEPGDTEMFDRLGLRLPDRLAREPAYQRHIVLAADQLGEIGADLLLAGHSPGLDERYRALPGFAAIPAAVLLSNAEVAAVEQPTALSMHHLLQRLLPALGDAAR